MSKQHPVRDLNKARVSTVNAYLSALREQGLEISIETNTVMASTPWAVATKESQRAFGQAIYALEEYLGYNSVDSALQQYVEYGDTISVDKYLDRLTSIKNTQVFLLEDLGSLPDSLCSFYTKEEAIKLINRLGEKIDSIENIIREINDELDDLYIVVVKQHDAYDFHHKLGAYAE